VKTKKEKNQTCEKRALSGYEKNSSLTKKIGEDLPVGKVARGKKKGEDPNPGGMTR